MEKLLSVVAGSIMIIMFAALLIVVAPYLQLEAMGPSEGLKPYSEAAARGRETYVALGCVYCHSQQPRSPAFGVDQVRGWGRPSVPGDYYYDSPHLLGTMRTGPDLMNIGARQPSIDWHLLHLYQPRAVLPNSIMPAYPFLFEEADLLLPEFKVVQVPDKFKPNKNREIIATQEALDLIQYLLELDRTFEVDVLYAPGDNNQASVIK